MICEDEAKLDELLFSDVFRSDSSSSVMRTGESGGKASSTTLRGGRTLLGELGERDGLTGRSGGGYKIWPAPLTPGRLCVLESGMARDAADRDLVCVLPPESGEVVRGRYGIDEAECQVGDLGDEGIGSVDRRSAWSRTRPSLSDVGVAGLWMRRLGTGEGRNSSIRSVSGTGSILAVDTYPGNGTVASYRLTRSIGSSKSCVLRREKPRFVLSPAMVQMNRASR